MREANFTFGSEDGVGYFKIQGGLTNFTGGNAVVTIFDGNGTDVTANYTVGQSTPGGSSNRIIVVEGGVGECGTARVNVKWTSSNSGGVITGAWSVVDTNGVDLSPEVLGLTCN